MKTLPLLSALFCLFHLAAESAQAQTTPVKPEVARAWQAKPQQFEGKPVATFVSGISPAGVFPGDVPYTVIPITTAEQNDKEGGDILLLVPPAEVEKTVAALIPGTGGKGTLFGNKRVLKRLDATFRVVGGEPVLVKGGDTAQLGKIGKPSVLLAEQLKAAGETVPTPAKYPKKDFLASQTGRPGRVETQAILDRLLPLINAQRQKEDSKAKALNADGLRRELRNGAEFVIDDDTAKTTWRVVWR